MDLETLKSRFRYEIFVMKSRVNAITNNYKRLKFIKNTLLPYKTYVVLTIKRSNTQSLALLKIVNAT